MTEPNVYQTYATSLRTDLQAADQDCVPRQEVLLDWIEDFLLRAKKRGFQVAQVDVDNLNAVDLFLRLNRIPATVRAVLK